MSSLTILSMAANARWPRAESGSRMRSSSMVGTICHESPNRSLSQPHCT